MTPVAPGDVPSPLDFHDRAQALAWIERTERERPYRPRLFRRMADELLAAGRRLSILELGSGPGALARHVVDACENVESYVLLDSSEAMLEISRARLAGVSADLRFLALDFRDVRWTESVGAVDAVLSMQAVHELRHKRHAPALYRQTASVLRPGGIVLVCDHVPGSTPDARRSVLFMTVEEQLSAFAAAGLKADVLLESDGLALYRAGRVRG